jgi:RNA polymerase sigma factor (sigma-70 family)
MPSPSLSAAVAGVARAVARRTDPDPSDGQLLARFVRSRDEAAFAELVRRHGPMVLGVCRRVAGDHHLAEDAFQAAFVVLARRAADVKPPGAVRPWLYGVAVRVAREARTMAAKRQARETPVAVLPDRPADAGRPPEEERELVALLDEEVGRLPDHLRAAVVLCELGGVSRKDAAARLGIPEGTLSSRLGKARKVLAARLTARGVALPAAGLAVLSDMAVPPRLLASTSAVATATRPLPAAVAALSDGVTRTMFLHKLTLATAGGLLLAVAGGLALAAFPGADPPAQADPPPTPKTAAAKPTPKGPNKILYHKAGHPTLIDPDGKNERRVAEELGPGVRGEARLSPDGERVAVLARLAKPDDPPADPNKPVQNPGGRLYVVAADGSEQPADLAVDECRTVVWSPDGAEVVTTEFRIPADPPKPGRREGRADITHTRVEVRTGKRDEFALPGGQLVTDWSRDGRYFVTTVRELGEDGREVPGVRLVNTDGTGRKDLTGPDDPGALGRLAPDGKRVLYVRLDPKTRTRVLVVRDVAGGKPAVVEVPDGGAVVGYCWSPDGKRIAYTRHGPTNGEQVEWTLTVCDPNGGSARVIARYAAPAQPLDTGGWVDWR